MSDDRRPGTPAAQPDDEATAALPAPGWDPDQEPTTVLRGPGDPVGERTVRLTPHLADSPTVPMTPRPATGADPAEPPAAAAPAAAADPDEPSATADVAASPATATAPSVVGAVSGGPVDTGGPAAGPESQDAERGESEGRGDGAAPVPGPSPQGHADPDADATGPGPAGPRRLLNVSSGSLLIALLLALFGFTLVVQLRSSGTDEGLAAARQEDLVRILSDLNAREQRLNEDIQGLEATRSRLASGVQGRQEALAEAQKRSDELGLLAGTVPARGGGLLVTISGRGDKPIGASKLLNAVQELRGAGGEVMQLAGRNGTVVRVVASTAFVDAGDGVLVGGEKLTGPYELTVIGDPDTMDTALKIPGGVVADVSRDGGTVSTVKRDVVDVTATREPTALRYARPVS